MYEREPVLMATAPHAHLGLEQTYTELHTEFPDNLISFELFSLNSQTT